MPVERQVTTRPATGTPPALRPAVFWTSCDSADGSVRYPPHIHGHHELIICERGRYRCRINGGTAELRAGGCLLVGPGDAHEDPLGGQVRYLACGFRLEPSADTQRSPALWRPGCANRTIPAVAGLSPLRERLLAAVAGTTDPCTWAALDAACGVWLWEAVRVLPADEVTAPFRLDRADDHAARLHAAFAAAIGRGAAVADLAAEAGMDPRAFAAACRRHLGMPPLAAFRRARCEAAAALLAQGVAVAETAERLGFANPFHFSRAFRRAMGVPPSAWRP